jgi:RNA polymerase sigma-70 factor, ECF subfamily
VTIAAADRVVHAGDQGADLEAQEFESFFRQHERALFGTLCLVTGDPREAEELMQEAFLKVWEAWHRIRLMDDPAAYLYRTAFNAFRSRLRRLLRAARHTVVGTSPAADAFAEIDERVDLLEALRALTPRQRAAVVLVDLLDVPSEEAGEILGVKAVTVRTLAFQARHALRARVEERDG